MNWLTFFLQVWDKYYLRFTSITLTMKLGATMTMQL
jgi:hypothetical protein